MNYLSKVHEKTKTRFWVNNPTVKDSKAAIANGAFACTTNPAYCSKLLQSAPEELHVVIDRVLAENSDADLGKLAEKVYHEVTKVHMDLFLPQYEASQGKNGFVTIQEDPRHEEDVPRFTEACLRAAELSPNYMAKIPVTEAGLQVIDAMVKHNIPVCATEVFSISQAKACLDVYEKAAAASGNRPVLFITHITGIMDDYFKDLVKKEKVEIDPELLAKAGTAIALKEYRLFTEIGFDGKLLGGGARNLGHFTDFVGGDLHVTINWSTAVELNETYDEVSENIDQVIPENVIEELRKKLPNFARAYDDDGMAVEEFADFGPVMLFRTQFLNGYVRLIDEIARRKHRA